jgi:YidC/Oxa1 family membrane protein insertase
MDRRSIIIVAVCVLLFFSWGQIVNRLFPPVPAPPSATQTTGGTNQVSAAGTNASAATTAAPASTTGTAPSNTPQGAQQYVVNQEIPEKLLVVSNDDARYTFTSRGGGLKEVQLFHYPETVVASTHATTNHNLATLNAASGPPVFALMGDKSLQDDGAFSLKPTEHGMRAEKTLTNGLTVIKDFQIGTNYLLTASVQLKNNNKEPLALPPRELMAGTATPMGPQDNGQALSVMWYNGVKAASVGLSWFNTNTVMLFVIPRTPTTEYREGSNNVFWASLQNQFFTLATMPQRPAESIVVHKVDLPPPSQEEIESNPRTVLHPAGLQASLTFPGEILAPGQIVTNDFNLFAGPKEYRTLTKLSDRFQNGIELVMGFNNWYGPISRGLLATMNWMHGSIGLNYGLIIILITIVIKMVFWPLTRASTRSMKRMQELQPQIKALQEKYKDDPQKLSQKQWEFWKKNKVNPLGGCLPMLLQIPVFFGFFGMLRSAIELRGTQFLWIKDLSQPDTIFVLPILGHHIPINPMPLIMGASQFWQASMTPPSPGMDPAQQKMMRYMPLVLVLFFYNYSAGLALYWTVSNLLTILQTRVTKVQPPAAAGAAKPAPAPMVPQKKKK